MRRVITDKSTFASSRIAKTINYVLMMLAAGSCMLVISVINTKDTYLEVLKNSAQENSGEILCFANVVFSAPVYALMILVIFAITGKELLLKSNSNKLKINAVSAVVLLSFCALVLQVISHPAS